MNKCLKIVLTTEPEEALLQDVQQYARKYVLEGMAQVIAQDRVKIIVCGKKGQVDAFVDALHKDLPAAQMEIEPFVKDKDYRGVFRVIT